MQCIETQELDLAILDIMLPGIDGFKLCKKIREHNIYPVIMLTAKDAEIDKINGLMLGADDYVTKPFKPLELMARVKAQLRRYKRFSVAEGAPSPDPILKYENLELDMASYECRLNGKPVALTPTEFSILRVLLENLGRVVSVEDLFKSIWKDEYYSKNSSTITVHIRNIREKLHDTEEKPFYIKTIWGVDYKI